MADMGAQAACFVIWGIKEWWSLEPYLFFFYVMSRVGTTGCVGTRSPYTVWFGVLGHFFFIFMALTLPLLICPRALCSTPTFQSWALLVGAPVPGFEPLWHSVVRAAPSVSSATGD